MMKNINNLILICGLIFASYSCEDATDIDPVGSLTSDVTFETLEDLKLGLNGAYARYNPETDILINSVFTDNCKPGYDNGGQEINFYNWALTAGDGNTTSLWNGCYSLINQCNRVLGASELISVSAAEQAELDNMKGELYTLRAVAHLTLASYFTTDYLDADALSVIISDRVPGVDETLPRNTNQEVFGFIETDLAMASSLLSATQTDNKYISQDFVTGLKARLALLQNDSSAITHAQSLIDSYSLANRLQYTATFLDSDNTEVIFKAARNSGLIGGLWYFTNSAGPFIEASNSLYNAFDSDDVRLFVNINFNSNNSGPSDPDNNIHLINKYPGNASAFLSDVKVMRVSEMYLIKAETQVTLNDLDGAAVTLKALRDARFGTSTALDSYATQTAAYNEVLKERRLELAFEGHRYLDIKRFKERLNSGINRDALDCASGGNCVMLPSDHRLTLPIPQVELNANPSIIQNPGYGN
jgi:hypothetical protein